jgi:hypothetical protein
MVRVRPNRVRYLLTPTGIAEKARIAQDYLRTTVTFYAHARNRIRERFEMLSETWSADGVHTDCADGQDPQIGQPRSKRIVFLGAGEVAEIGYICLHGTDLDLVGVVDDNAERFFNVPVFPRKDLQHDAVAGCPYDRLVVMSLADSNAVREKIADLGIAESRVFWL